jgi:uncharacterized protein YndB with AHSA1/START domain
MARMQRVIVDHDFPFPVERAYAHLAEHENLAEVFGAKIKRLRDGTDGTRNGVGSVRQLKVGPAPWFEETVTEAVPNELIRYRITKGSPLKDHAGEMRFTSNADGNAHLHYEIAFGSKIPGIDRIVARSLRGSIEKGLKKVDATA